MTTDPATFTGLLDFGSANDIPIDDWIQNEYSGQWYRQTPTGIVYAEDATPKDIKSVCFEVARWLHLENGVLLRRDCDGFWIMLTFWDSPNRENDSVITKRLDCSDNEPAALLAACKEVGK